MHKICLAITHNHDLVLKNILIISRLDYNLIYWSDDLTKFFNNLCMFFWRFVSVPTTGSNPIWLRSITFYQASFGVLTQCGKTRILHTHNEIFRESNSCCTNYLIHTRTVDFTKFFHRNRQNSKFLQFPHCAQAIQVIPLWQWEEGEFWNQHLSTVKLLFFK